MKTTSSISTLAALFAAGALSLAFSLQAQEYRVPFPRPDNEAVGTASPAPAPGSQVSQPAVQLPADLSAIASAKDPSAAEAAFARAKAARGEDPALYDVFINRMLSLGAIDTLRQPVEKLVQLNPSSGLGWALSGFFKAQDGQMNQAFADTARGTDLTPDDPYVLQLAGQLAAWYDFQADSAALGTDVRRAMVKLNKFSDKAPFVDGYTATTAALRQQAAASPTAPSSQVYVPEAIAAPQPVYNAYPYYLDPYPSYYSYYPYGFYYPQLFSFFGFGFGHHHRHHDWVDWGSSWWNGGWWGGHHGHGDWDDHRWSGRGDWSGRQWSRGSVVNNNVAVARAAPALTGEQILRDPATRGRWDSNRRSTAQTIVNNNNTVTAQRLTDAQRAGSTVQSGATVNRTGVRTTEGARTTGDRRVVSGAAAGTTAINSATVRAARDVARGNTTIGGAGQARLQNRSAARIASPSGSSGSFSGSPTPTRQVQPRIGFDTRRLSTPTPSRQVQPQRSAPAQRMSSPAPTRQVQPARSSSPPRAAVRSSGSSRSFSAPRSSGRSAAAPRSSGGGRSAARSGGGGGRSGGGGRGGHR